MTETSLRWRIAARGSNVAARRLGPVMRLAGRLQARVYEATGGRLWKRFLGTPVIVLEVVGRRSGELRRIPLLYARDGDRWILLAANGGNPRTPAWWLNLRAAGSGTVVARGKRVPCDVREATAEEYDPLFTKLVANYPPAADYATFTDRHIPIVVFEPQ